MEVTTEMLFAIIGELFVQTRMQSRMLQTRENGNATAERTIPDYQAWRKEHPDSVVETNREGPRSEGIPPGERL